MDFPSQSNSLNKCSGVADGTNLACQGSETGLSKSLGLPFPMPCSLETMVGKEGGSFPLYWIRIGYNNIDNIGIHSVRWEDDAQSQSSSVVICCHLLRELCSSTWSGNHPYKEWFCCQEQTVIWVLIFIPLVNNYRQVYLSIDKISFTLKTKSYYS